MIFTHSCVAQNSSALYWMVAGSDLSHLTGCACPNTVGCLSLSLLPLTLEDFLPLVINPLKVFLLVISHCQVATSPGKSRYFPVPT
jgi:hypothetical protein